MDNKLFIKMTDSDEAEAINSVEKVNKSQGPMVFSGVKLPQFKLHDGGSSRSIPLRKELAKKIQEFQL